MLRFRSIISSTEEYMGVGRSVCARMIGKSIAPFEPHIRSLWLAFLERQDAYRKAMETFDVPLELYPEPGGLLPFGHRDDVYFTWKTDGKANDWKVIVIWLYQNDAYKSFDMGFCQFLTSLLKRKIQVPGFTSKWNPRKDITFEPEVYSG